MRPTGEVPPDPGAPLRLDYLSPLPPVRSGIADYSADLLPHLEGRCELRVLRVTGQPVSAAIAERYRPVDMSEAGADGRLPCYHVGNNPYHEPIVERALQQPGVVTLHDVWLHHLLQEQTLAHADLDGYVRRLVDDHGWIGGAIALAPRWGAYGKSALFALPAHRTLLERQLGVLVHSDWARGVLEEEGITRPVRVVPMPMPVPGLDPLGGRAFRARLGIGAGTFLLGSFGFQTPIKRTETVVRALALPGLERLELLVAGELSPAVALEPLARELGVSDRVHVTGFLSSDELQDAIQACDLCVNLRYPTAGETSASLLRILAAGCGAVVSDYAQFAELPADSVVRVPLDPVAGGGEVAALAAELGALARASERCRAMGEAARRRIEREHDPAACASQAVEALTELRREGAPQGARPFAAQPPTALTWGLLPGAIEVHGARDWLPGEQRELRVVVRNDGFCRWAAGESGPGGVAIELRLHAEGGNELRDRPWLALPRALAPGERCELRLRLRRPPGPCRLELVPHVLGGFELAALGGPGAELEMA